MYLTSLLITTLFAFAAGLSAEDLDRTLPRYLALILLPLFAVCAIEALGGHEVAAFFAGPEYLDRDRERAGLLRVNGVFHWPLLLANYLSVLYVLFLWRARRSFVILAGTVAIFVFLAMTLSRSHVIACVLITLWMAAKEGRRYRRYSLAALCALGLLLAASEVVDRVTGETMEQYVRHRSWRTYYVEEGLRIAQGNWPLGEGAYSTGAFSERMGRNNFKLKHRLATENIKTTDSFVGAALIEFGGLGCAVLAGLWIWLFLGDSLGVVRYLLVLSPRYRVCRCGHSLDQ